MVFECSVSETGRLQSKKGYDTVIGPLRTAEGCELSVHLFLFTVYRDGHPRDWRMIQNLMSESQWLKGGVSRAARAHDGLYPYSNAGRSRCLLLDG